MIAPSADLTANVERARHPEAEREGRARTRRMGRHFAGISAGLGATMVSNLLLVPVLYRHLGPEAFGVWALFAGVLVMLGAVDPGNALVHRLTTVLAVDDRSTAARLVSASLVATSGVAIALICVFGVASVFVDWASLWNVGDGLASDARAATVVLVVAVALGLPAALADKLNLARQLAGRNGSLSALVAVATLVTTIVVVHLGGRLPGVVAATTIPAVVVRTGWLLAILSRDQRVRPARRLDGSLRLLLRASAAFTILQFCAIISFNSDQLVVARVLGPLAVTEYAVPAKAFAILLAVSGAMTTALWPAFLEAVARHDARWVRSETRRIAGLAGVSGLVFGVSLVVLGPWALSAWVGGGYEPDRLLLVAFACWGLVYVVTNVVGFILLSFGSLRPLVGLSVLNMIINVGVSVMLTRRVGVSGAVWGSVLSYLAVMAIPLCLLVRHGMARLSVAGAAP
jgi:O-antigen/teichoic acid export membrane protein